MSKTEIKANPKNNKVSYKVSLGGIVAALCLVMMFLTAVFPPLNMTLPLFAGMLILVVAIEVSASWALVTYATVTILSFFITPDKQAAIFFALIFGYYPVLKDIIEKHKSVVMRLILKIIIFNIAIILIYQLLVKLLGTVDLMEEFGFMNEFMMPVLILILNGTLFLYDYTLGLIKECYLKWFRPTFLRKCK
ncbi:MAG: hypothetical protein IJX24_07465 [Oscillospiraceae bacterium]|nr:hypothetical protein [Oscillospiraceae bacterium]